MSTHARTSYEPPSQQALLDAALKYAEIGFAVLPLHTVTASECSCGNSACSSKGKHPATPRGLKDATTDPPTIRRWWEHNAHNIGVIPASAGFVVVDVDPWKDGEDDRLDRLIALHGDLPATLTIYSGEHDGQRGKHYWFKLPAGQSISKSKASGIDLKSSGGYVVMPPSSHRTGVNYEMSAGDFDTVAELPLWLLDGEGEKITGASEPLPLGNRTLDAMACGLPEPSDGSTQREVAVGITRNLAEAGLPHKATLALMENVMLRPESALRPESPWSRSDVEAIVKSVYATDAPGLDQRRSSRRRFELKSLNDALTISAEEVDWVIPDLLAASEKMVIGGPPKSMKTWFALALTRAVALGEPFLGEDEWTASNPQPVVIVQEEGARQRWAQRLADVFEGEGSAPVYYMHREGFSVIDEQHLAWLVESAKDVGARLIVLDPWQRITPGVRENDATDTAPAWDAIHELARRTGAAVCVLHHTSKGDGPPSMDSLRGSSRMAGEVDLLTILKKTEAYRLEMFLDGRDLVRREDDVGNLEIAVDRERPFRMTTTGQKIVLKGPVNRTRKAIQSVLQNAVAPMKVMDITESVGSELGENRSRQVVQEQLDAMKDAGLVEKDARGRGKATYWSWVS